MTSAGTQTVKVDGSAKRQFVCDCDASFTSALSLKLTIRTISQTEREGECLYKTFINAT